MGASSVACTAAFLHDWAGPDADTLQRQHERRIQEYDGRRMWEPSNRATPFPQVTQDSKLALW
jgi:hypothetical protein